MKFQTRQSIAYWPLGSVLRRPLEILCSFFQCSLSRVALHLFQASRKPGRQEGIALQFWCSGTGCQGLHSLKKGSRSPLKIVTHLSPRQMWAGSNPWHLPSASRCPHSLNASISKFLSAPRKPPLLSLQAATDLRSDSAKHLPYPDQLQHWFLQDIAVKILAVWQGSFWVSSFPWGKLRLTHLCTWSCPMCPDCYHTSKLPTLEWLFQHWRDLLWITLAALVCKLRERQWSFHSEINLLAMEKAKVVNLLTIPHGTAKNVHEKAEKHMQSTNS